ncbi:MAG: hypothetical protein SFT92_03025 [Rickettsiales bacterium]|nr:hypothetical protein [Rickettsiales bacterium]
MPAEAISDRVKELIEDKYPEHKEAIEAFMKALLEKDKQKEIPLERDTEDRERDKRLLERQSREFGEKIKRPLETLLGKIKPYIDSTYDERSYPIDGDVIKKEMVAILRRENNVTHPIRADEPVATVSKSEAPLDQGIQFSPEAGMYKIAEEEVPAKPAAPAHQETMDLDGRSGLLKSFDQLPAMADDPSKLAALRASFRQVYAFMSVKAIDDAALKSDDNYTSRHLAEIAGMMKLIDDAFDSPQFKKSENAYHELGKVEAAGKNVDRGVKKRELLDHATRSAERDLGLKL